MNKIQLARRVFLISRDLGKYLFLEDGLIFHIVASDDDLPYVARALADHPWVRKLDHGKWEIISD